MYGLALTDNTLTEALAFPSMIIDIVSTETFLTSVANVSHYSRTGQNKVKHTSLKIDLVPLVSVENRRAGMVLNAAIVL
jgi:hypothetical protein